MADIVLIDSLNPPAPADLVRDLETAGASAAGLYVLRRSAAGTIIGNGTWTAAHVAAVLRSGRGVLPIVVPGDRPVDGDWNLALSVARSFGVPAGPIVVDLENFSFPPAAWVGAFIAAVRRDGWRAIRYGDLVPLRGYPTGDGDWISHGLIPVRAGALRPVPALPAGCIADQYAVQVTINGHGYDASVASPALFAGTAAPSRRLPVRGEDAMGNLIPYEVPVLVDGTVDPKATQPLGEVYCSEEGEATWGVWTGGAGQMESYIEPLTTLGSPEDAKDLVDANGAHAYHQGVLRLHVRGVREDGRRWLAVYDAHSFRQIAPWKLMPSLPRQYIPAAEGQVGPPGPAGPAVDDSHIAAVAVAAAVAEIEKRLENG